MICDDVRAALAAGEVCEETEYGARVPTHCMYPSFQRVEVFVSRFGDGFRVTDAGRALAVAWEHGRDETMVRRILSKEAARWGLVLDGSALVAEARSADWLAAAIMGVANAASAAAHSAISKSVAAAEDILREKIFATLSLVFREREIGKDFEFVGKSGDIRHFDYGVRAENDGLILLNAVSPHHSSIYAKYVAFADAREAEVEMTRLAVFDRQLGHGDASLLLQVADLVPLDRLEVGTRRMLHS